MGGFKNSKGTKGSKGYGDAKNKGSWEMWGGKGNGWGEQSWSEWDGGDPSSSSAAAAVKSVQGKGRLRSNWSFGKGSMRPYSDEEGSSLYVKDDSDLQRSSFLKETLSADNSTMFRNPATGISVCSGTVSAGLEVLKELKMDTMSIEASGWKYLAKIASSEKGGPFVDALKTVNTGGKSKSVNEEELEKALRSISDFVMQNRKDLLRNLGRSAVASSRLYLMSMLGLELVTAFASPENWVDKIPEGTSEHKTFQKWQDKGKDQERMIAFLLKAFREKEKAAKKYEKGRNAASSVFGDWAADDSSEEAPRRKRKRSASSDDSEEDKKKKDDKKNKKDKEKDKKRKKDSSSSASSSAKDKKKKDGKKNKKDKEQDKRKKDSSSSASSSAKDKKKRDKKEHAKKKKKDAKDGKSGSGDSDDSDEKRRKAKETTELAEKERTEGAPAAEVVDSDADAKKDEKDVKKDDE
jgi:hypothetical protein